MATFSFPTEEQEIARKAFATGDDMVISAYAGSGKTATLTLLAADDPRARGRRGHGACRRTTWPCKVQGRSQLLLQRRAGDRLDARPLRAWCGHVNLRAYLVPLARKMWADKQLKNGQCAFTHDDYFKMWSLSNPRLPYDVVMVDEAQDSNPALISWWEQKQAQKVIGRRCQPADLRLARRCRCAD
jgi:hypothetical protein